MKYQTPTLLALNQNTGVACHWTSAAKDCNLLRQYKDTRPVLSENPSNGLAESKNAKSLLRRSTEKLISKANLRHRPRPIGKHSSIPSFTANPGFAQFLREHSSPKHHRVTAGGRIVPMQPVDRTMSAESQETPDDQRGFQNINMQQTPQGYMNAPPSQQGWQPLASLAHQIQPPQYQGNTFNPPHQHPSFNLYYSVGSPAHDPETGTQSNGNSFSMDPANQAGMVFWNNAQTSLIATPDALAHFAATVMNEIESSMVNIEQMRSLQFNLIQHRLNVQEALDQANIAIAWTQVTQPIQRDLRITYINMRNILDEAIGILESRMQLIHTSTIPVHYCVGQPTGTNMSPPGDSFVNQAASEQTNMNWEVSSNSGISVSHIELADVDPQINWEVSSNSGISVSHIEFADVNPQMNWEVSSNSGVSVAHIESADMEPQADTANEMQSNSHYDDDTAFMGSSRLEWSPKRNLRADDSDCDNESDLEDLQHNQLDGTCLEEGMRRASDDELSPRRSSGFRVNKAQIEGPSQFSWFSWPGNFLETDYDALLGVGHDIEPELAKAQQNWGKNSMRGKPFEGPLDSDQDEDRDGNETESECCGEDLAQNAPPLSRRGSKSGEADNDINDSLTSDEWTIFLSPPRYSHRLRSSPTVSSEVNKIDPIMPDNHNENSAANPEGGQADLPETATEAIVVRLPDPLHLGNGVVRAQPTNLMAANYVGEMEEGNNNNNDRRRRSQAGHATVQLSTAGALGELTQVARDSGARPTPAAEALQQALANEATPSARRRLGRRMAQRREGHEEGLDDSDQEGTVARPSTPTDPISPGHRAYLQRVAAETLEEMAWREAMARRAAMANGPNGVVNHDEEMNDE